MKFIHIVGEGEMIPAWYGAAWRDLPTFNTICMPVPFNILAAIVRGTYYWLRFGYRCVPQSPRDAYHQGFKDGRKFEEMRK